MPRSRWLEAACDDRATPVLERSPVVEPETEASREPPGPGLMTARQIEEQRQAEAGEGF